MFIYFKSNFQMNKFIKVLHLITHWQLNCYLIQCNNSRTDNDYINCAKPDYH